MNIGDWQKEYIKDYDYQLEKLKLKKLLKENNNVNSIGEILQDKINYLQKELFKEKEINDKQNKALYLMAQELTTPIHGVDWVVNYYLEKAEGLYD